MTSLSWKVIACRQHAFPLSTLEIILPKGIKECPSTAISSSYISLLGPRFNTDYLSAENVPEIKDRVKIGIEQVAPKVTCPVSWCSLPTHDARSTQVIFLLHQLVFFISMQCPITQNHIRLQNLGSFCIGRKRGHVPAAQMCQGAAEVEPSTTGKRKGSLGISF